MENKVAVIVVVALVIGLVAGYAITYISYQAQVNTLQKMADDYSAKIDDLNAIIAGLHPSTSPTPSPTVTPSGSPGPTSTPNSTIPVSLEVFDQNTGQEGNYYYINFTVHNSGQTSATLQWVYLNSVRNQALTGLSSMTVNGVGKTPNGIVNVTLQPGESAIIKLEGTAGDATNTIWQPGMGVTAAIDTTNSPQIFTSGSFVSFPG